jgi:hypothetical protein
LNKLGTENFDKNEVDYIILTYFLYPREVAISLGEPPSLHLDKLAGRSPVSLKLSGRNPVSLEELQQAGYDFAVKINAGQALSVLQLGSSRPQMDARPKPIPGGDAIVALLLPLAVAITGSRMVRWLFKDLQGVLSTGEWLACGLALGAYFLTQLILGLRLAGLRWERALIAVITVWAVAEVVLLTCRWRPTRPQFKARCLWWLLLLPAGLILWCQFRLAGLLDIQDPDAVAIWAFKAKILYSCAGKEIWKWFQNPGLAFAHMDYPLLVALLHALTYGALGHLNDFVTKFWNQWMLLLLAWAILGAVRFPDKRPWLSGAVITTVLLLAMTRQFTVTEGATIPMLFYTVLSSVQLAIGVMEKHAGRLRLGLLLLMATAMVKFEGMILIALWGIVLLLDRTSRAVLWSPRRIGWVGLLGLAAWLPYVVFRWHGPVTHPESAWLSQWLTHTGVVFHMLPMSWVAMVSRRFLNNDFAIWIAPDNQHAVWPGHWLGWQSFIDPWTQGMGWVCVLFLIVAWRQGGRLRWTSFRVFLVFMAFATTLNLVWSAVNASLMNYNRALLLTNWSAGGRYLYPVLMAWFVAGAILLLRTSARGLIDSNAQEHAGRLDQPTTRQMT